MPAAIEATTRLLDRLNDQAGVTLQSPEAEPVHDLRVAIRRLRQSLAVFEPELSKRQTRKLEKRLKNLISLAGEVRDRDIAGELLRKDGAGAPRLEKKLGRQRASAAKALVAELAKWKAVRPKETAELTLEEAASRELPGAVKRFFEKGNEAAESGSSAGDLHRFRIRAKKFRYTLELFVPVFGEVVEERIGQLKEVQKLLGEINDFSTTRVLAAELGADGELDARLKRRQRRYTARFRKVWNEQFAAREVERRWTRALRVRPAKPHTANEVVETPIEAAHKGK